MFAYIGGQGTAGLGGVGGPYRLDAGHDVFQVSDQDKANVPIEVGVCLVRHRKKISFL